MFTPLGVYILSQAEKLDEFTESQLSALNSDEWLIDLLVNHDDLATLIILAQLGNASFRAEFESATVFGEGRMCARYSATR